MKVKRYSFHLRICLQPNHPQIFVWKGNSTEKDKKLTSLFAIEGVFFYWYRDSKDITVAEHAGEQLVASDHGGCCMASHYDCCESDGKVESVAKTIALNFSLL